MPTFPVRAVQVKRRTQTSPVHRPWRSEVRKWEADPRPEPEAAPPLGSHHSPALVGPRGPPLALLLQKHKQQTNNKLKVCSWRAKSRCDVKEAVSVLQPGGRWFQHRSGSFPNARVHIRSKREDPDDKQSQSYSSATHERTLLKSHNRRVAVRERAEVDPSLQRFMSFSLISNTRFQPEIISN
ncbi:uncharacterized protein V6R79_016918 [Siganus canaliculatus]